MLFIFVDTIIVHTQSQVQRTAQILLSICFPFRKWNLQETSQEERSS